MKAGSCPIFTQHPLQGIPCCICRDFGVATRAEKKANHPQTLWFSAKLLSSCRATGEVSWSGGGSCRCSLQPISSRAAGESSPGGGTLQPPASRQPGGDTAAGRHTQPAGAEPCACRRCAGGI